MRHRTDFPALSGAISAVNKTLTSESENISSLASTILQDFALTNKILRLVSSVGFSGAGGHISTISRAVQILGFDQVRNNAVSLMLFEHLQNRAQAGALRDEFVKTLFCGVLARAVAPRAAVRGPREAFVCALFHTLGRLLCLLYFPEEWTEVQRLVAEGRKEEAAAAERVRGASFEQLGIGTAEARGFPKKICYSTRLLPTGPIRKASSQHDRLRLVSTFASDISAAAGSKDDERAAAFARIGSCDNGALPFDAGQIGTLVTDSLASLGTCASALNLSVLRDPANATMASNVSAPVDAQAELASGILDLSNAPVEGMPMNEVLRIVLETKYRAIGFRRVLLCVRDIKANAMTGRFDFGDDAAAITKRFGFSMQFKPGVFFAALTRNADILLADVDEPKSAARIPDWYRSAVRARTFLVFPLIVNHKPFRLICADAERSGQIDISANVLRQPRTLRNQAVLAIKQTR